MMGSYARESLLETALRQIAIKYSNDPDIEWAEKYGTKYEDGRFMMHPYCWCGKDECKWCGDAQHPNFFYKPIGIKVWWYKYIGRGMDIEPDNITNGQVAEMLNDLLNN